MTVKKLEVDLILTIKLFYQAFKVSIWKKKNKIIKIYL